MNKQSASVTCRNQLAYFQRVQFAKTDSDLIAKMKGTFVDKPKKTIEKKKKKPTKEISAKTGAPGGGSAISHSTAPSHRSQGMCLPAYVWLCAIGCLLSMNSLILGLGPVGEQPPNAILFITNLHEDTTEGMLSMLFSQ